MMVTKEARKLYLASGNAGKLKEFRVLAEGFGKNWRFELLPDYATLPVLTGTPEGFSKELKKLAVKTQLRVMKVGETIAI